MAEYRPKNRGLERVLGTGALFSTAYGNVGSSIYYALGLVAIYAAGMTPVVFVIAGLIFAATAATYAEATTMFPEAGGSSSFARRAFNEFWSFFAAWGQMLTYIITIAISAFFVPHYLAVFWEPLGESPTDIIAGIIVVALLGSLNIVGVKESAGVNIGFAVADFLTQVVLVVVGVVLVFDPDLLVRQIDLGTTPTIGRLPDRHPGGDGGLHGHRDDLEHGRGGQGLRQDDSARDRPRGRRGRGDLHVPPGGGAVGDAGQERRDAPRPPEGGGRLRRRPGARRGREHGPRLVRSTRRRSTSASSPPRSCSSPPTPASSGSRGSATRWGSIASSPSCSGRSTRASAPPTSRSRSSAAWPASRSCLARPTSSA